MKTTANLFRRFARHSTLPLFSAIMVAFTATAPAATTGFNQTAAGPWDYSTAANWANNAINGLWDTSLTLTATQSVTFGADTALTTGLTFNHNGNFALTLRSAGSANQTITLGGDIFVTPLLNQTVNIGSATANQNLNVDLGGGTRTLTVGAGKTLTMVNAVSNGGISKEGAGILIFSGANTYTGTTTVNGGVLRLGNADALSGGIGATGGTAALTINSGVVELTTTGGSLLRDLGTGGAQVQITGGTSGFSAFNATTVNFNNDAHEIQWDTPSFAPTTLVLNESTAAAKLTFANAIDLNGSTRTVTVNANTAEISGAIRTTTGTAGLTKSGTGTLILSAANTYDGATTLNGGTLTLNSNTGSLSSGLTFANTGTFNMDNAGATGALSISLGTLTLSAGDGTVKETRTAAQDQMLTFPSVPARTAGATGNFWLSSGTASVTNGFTLTGQAAGFIDQGTFFGGGTTAASYAWIDVDTYVRGINYASDTGAQSTAGGTALPTGYDYVETTAAITAQGTDTFKSIRIRNTANSAQAFTLASGTTLTVNGILRAGNGGASSTTTISGGTAIQAANDAELVIRNDMSNDPLTISTPIVANGTNALTKSGVGTLTLNAANTFTGGLAVNAGTLTISGTGRLNSGDYSGAVFIGSVAILNYTSTQAQIFRGDFTGNGSLNIGSASAGALTLYGTTSIGNLNSTGTAAGKITVNGSLAIGGGSANTADIGNQAASCTLDLSSATSLNVNVGTWMIGHNSGSATVTLGASSSITATTGLGIGMGGNFIGAAQNIGIGTVNVKANCSPTISTPILQVGMEKQNSGTLKMLGAGTLTLQGTSGGRTTVYIGSQIATTNGAGTVGSVDLATGTANLLLEKLYVGVNTGNATTAWTTTGTLTLGSDADNHLDISGAGSVVQIGGAVNRGTPTGTVTIGNLNATSSITSTNNGTAVLIANRPNASDTAIGTLNLNGGTLTITTTGSAIAGGGGTSTLVLGNAAGSGSGMTLKAGASSVGGAKWITGLSAAKIKTTGVTFDTAGYDIAIDQALLEDATDIGGTLTKASAGTLTLSGANTYTGATTVSGGTLALGASNVLPDASNVSIGAATLDAATFTDTAGTLDVTGAATIHLGADAALVFADSSSLTWAGTLNLTGTFVSGSSIKFGTDPNGLTPTQLGLISATGYSSFALDANGFLTASSGATLDHFEISTITSPQTVGTPITGITLTAKDADDNTFTGFIGTVDFSGTAGITGTSGAFTSGQLTGVSVTPLNSGSGLTFIVTATGGTAPGTATFNVQTQYEAWAGGAAFTADTNSDGVPNGLAWLLGAGSTSANSLALLPKASQVGGSLVLSFDCLKKAKRGTAVLKVQYSSDLGATDAWTSHEAEVPASGDTVSGIVFTVTELDTTRDRVTASFPGTGKVFGRLSATP